MTIRKDWEREIQKKKDRKRKREKKKTDSEKDKDRERKRAKKEDRERKREWVGYGFPPPWIRRWYRSIDFFRCYQKTVSFLKKTKFKKNIFF